MQTIECAERRSDPMEHRWGQRVTLEVPVKLQFDGRVLGHGVLRNASISGALIETTLELPLYSNLVVAMPTLSELTTGSHALAACLVRRAPGGFAVEWRDMACPEIVALLERFTGQRVSALIEDEAYSQRRGTARA